MTILLRRLTCLVDLQSRPWRGSSMWVRSYNSTKSDRLRILFFGTDEFASSHLKALIKEKDDNRTCIESVSLVCPPDRLTGRKRNILTPSPTKGLGELYSIPIFHTPEDAKTLDDWQLPPGKYDLGVVVSFGYFIPPHIISAFKYGAINVHPSLLPKYRGAAPIQHAILKGDDVTGVTVQELDDKKFDAGRILVQKSVDLMDDFAPRFKELRDRLAAVGNKLLVSTVRNLSRYKANARPQNPDEVTMAPKIQKEWSEIDFDTMEAWQIEQLHRAIGEQYPLRTVFTFTRIKRSKKVKQKFFTMQLLNIYLPTRSAFYDERWVPGTFYLDGATNDLHVVCANGTVIGLTHIKAESKEAITAKDFVNGYEIRNQGQFGYISEDEIMAGMSGVRVTKRREEYEKTIRKRLGMRKYDYERLYKNKYSNSF